MVVGAIFVVLLAYVILVETKREPPPRPGVTPSPTPFSLVDMPLDEVRALRVTDGERTLRLIHEGVDWRIVEPENAPADT